MVFSGVFIAYVVFALHQTMSKARQKAVADTKEKLSEGVFDVALFVTIVALILREGFEVALFTASVSLFADFMTNVSGLLAGFAGASILGTAVYFSYTKFPIKKIFTLTEYSIIALGSVMMASGLMKLANLQFGIDLSSVLAFPVPFLDNAVSMLPVVFVALYIGTVYVLFMRKKKETPAS